jgi:glycosyl transferase, family 25
MDEFTILFIIIVSIILALIIISMMLLFVNQSDSSMDPTMDPIPEKSFYFPVFIINLDRKPGRYVYITEQLDALGITNYQKISGTDGFKVSDETMLSLGIHQELIDRGRGLAGCASSHIRAWKHIVNNNLDWTLILEDDAHFHPQFMSLFHNYWKNVPQDAKIIFPGFCGPEEIEKNNNLIIKRQVMCLHGYMLNSEGAKYLLDNLLPMKLPVDIVIDNHFAKHSGSYIFNGSISVDGIIPNNYKEQNGRRCMFNGIIYQNHEEQGSTIHGIDTVF